MSLRGLAEGIILQSIEDLWSDNHRDECIAFFAGNEFNLCAEIAGMNLSEQFKVLNLVKTVIGTTSESRKSFSTGEGKPVKAVRRAYRDMQAVP